MSSTVVDDEIDSFDVDTSSEEVGGNEEAGAVGFEEIVVLDSFLLFQLGVYADGIEQFLSEKFGQFLGAVDPIDEDDHLVEGESVEQVCQFLEFFVLVDVDVELGQAVQDELALVDEDVHLVGQELLAVLLHLLRHGGAEHQHLLVVRSLDEDVLNIRSHLGISEDFVALVHHEELALNHRGGTLSKLMSLCFARSYRRPGVEMMMWGVRAGSFNSVSFYSRGTPPK